MKPSYIEITLSLRLILGIPLFLISWLLFLLLYVYLVVEYQISWLGEVIIPLSIVTAIMPSLAFILSERILKRLSKTWMYSRFLFLQHLFGTLTFETIAYFIAFFYFAWRYGPLPLWTLLLTLALLGVLIASVALSDVFSYSGGGILSIMAFEEDFKSEPNEADFGKILFAAKRISQIAKSYNIEVSPYALSLGMTLSFIEKSEIAQKDFDDLMGWMEKPATEANFKRFRELVKKFISVAKESSKDGLTEKHHWPIESKIAFLGAAIIPISVTVLAIVLPKLIELLSQT